jgi:type IV pilus assembly protein PilC
MKFNDSELRDLFKEINMCYLSGISIKESFDIVSSEVEDGDLKNSLNVVLKSLDEGNNLYDSLNLVEEFDNYMLSVIRVGEKTGYLDRVFNELKNYYDRLYNMKKRLKEALTYPVILLITMMIILFVLVTKILPIFKEVLNSMGTDLNAMAYVLMNIGNFISTFGFTIIMLLLLITFALYIYNKQKYKDLWLVKIFYNSWVTKNLSKEFSTSKYLYGLNLLLKSGNYNEENLEMLNSLVENADIKKKCIHISEEFKKDRDLTASIILSGLLNSRNNKLLKIAYRTGKSDEAIDSLCKDYDTTVEKAINDFVNTIEPTLLVICVILVSIILLSVMLPLISIMVGM